MRRTLIILGLCAALGACSSSGSKTVSTSAPSTTATGAAATSPVAVTNTAAATPTVTPTATNAAAAPGTTAAATPSGTIDPCAIVTTDDVAAAFGGTVAAGVLNPDNGGCDYEITGQTNTGPSGILTQVSIELKSDYISIDKEKVVFPEIEKVDGVGSEAWYYASAHQLHINLGGRELLISGLFPGDEAAVKAEVVAFAKTVIAKL
ncbi:MAG: hypothetical protein ACXWBO_15040 [Ilumatobacteraceae bacterium]